MMDVAQSQDLVTRTAMEGVIKLFLIVELDRTGQQPLYISKAIKDGIAASSKSSGRKQGQVDKLSPELKANIYKYLHD
jgi:hypothetical protein